MGFGRTSAQSKTSRKSARDKKQKAQTLRDQTDTCQAIRTSKREIRITPRKLHQMNKKGRCWEKVKVQIRHVKSEDRKDVVDSFVIKNNVHTFIRARDKHTFEVVMVAVDSDGGKDRIKIELKKGRAPPPPTKAARGNSLLPHQQFCRAGTMHVAATMPVAFALCQTTTMNPLHMAQKSTGLVVQARAIEPGGSSAMLPVSAASPVMGAVMPVAAATSSSSSTTTSSYPSALLPPPNMDDLEDPNVVDDAYARAPGPPEKPSATAASDAYSSAPDPPEKPKPALYSGGLDLDDLEDADQVEDDADMLTPVPARSSSSAQPKDEGDLELDDLEDPEDNSEVIRRLSSDTGAPSEPPKQRHDDIGLDDLDDPEDVTAVVRRMSVVSVTDTTTDAQADADAEIEYMDSLLPAPWVTYRDHDTGVLYFYNPETDESSWDMPTKCAGLAQRRVGKATLFTLRSYVSTLGSESSPDKAETTAIYAPLQLLRDHGLNVSNAVATVPKTEGGVLELGLAFVSAEALRQDTDPSNSTETLYIPMDE